MTTQAATPAVNDATPDTTTDTESTSTGKTQQLSEKANQIIGQARDGIEGAYGSTVDTVKKHPGAAAAIAAGAAAAVAGAAYGVSKLVGSKESTNGKPGGAKSSKTTKK